MDTRSQGIRRWTWRLVKWGVVLFLLLGVVNWTIAHFVAAANQRKIERLHAALGASSLPELAGLRRMAREEGGNLIQTALGKGSAEELGWQEFETVPILGNGWYPLLGALSCISEASRDAIRAEESYKTGQSGAPMNEAQIATMEQELDNAHGFLELARKAPRILADRPYSNPYERWLPLGPVALTFTKLAARSARDRLKAGDEAKAAERLRDGLTLTRQYFEPPILIDYLIAVTQIRALLENFGPSVQRFGIPSLERLQECFGKITLENRLRNAVGGEVLFHLSLWQHGMGRELQRWTGYPTFVRWIYFRALSELDKSVYLDRMLPQVLAPDSPKTASIAAKSAPFYALVTARFCMNVVPGVARTDRQRKRMLAICREAIRLELAHRREGKWPAPRAAIGGVTIEVTETDESITLAEPPPARGTPFQIVLRK
jgi:hypothetical protein